MHTNGPREDPLVELGYEHRDVDYPKLRKAIIIFFGFGIVSAIIGGIIYVYRFSFLNIKPGEKPGDPAMVRRIPGTPNPLLQNNVSTKTDIADLRQAETARLDGTGYNDASQSSTHIPIERAMELTVERGIAPTGNQTPAVSLGNTSGQNNTPAPSGTVVPGAGTGTTTSPDTPTNVPGDPSGATATPSTTER